MSKRTDLEQHLIQENARLRVENRDLLDRIMHMADRSWNVAPIDLLEPDKEPEDEGWVSDPSQVIEEPWVSNSEGYQQPRMPVLSDLPEA